jgi:hypothetical protein
MLKRIFYRQTKAREAPASAWSNPAEFDEVWKRRITVMASYIRSPGVVADFGAGMMWLKPLLSPANPHLAIDFIRRDAETLVLDLNRDSLAEIRADIGFLSGVLEYIADVPTFARNLTALPLRQIILSYCTLEKHGDLQARRNLNWASHESIFTLLPPFLKRYHLSALDDVNGNTILVFERKEE